MHVCVVYSVFVCLRLHFSHYTFSHTHLKEIKKKQK